MVTLGLSSKTYRAAADEQRREAQGAAAKKLREVRAQYRSDWGVHLYVGGSLVRVRPPKLLGARPGPGGVRGKCQGFSAGSRRRLFRKLAMLKREQVSAGKFLTLTYPEDYPTPGIAKGHLRAFLKRLRRRWPQAAVIWKLEPQRRGAPHFHVLVLGVEHIGKDWLSRAWYEVVASGDERHLRAGTQIEAVRSYRGAMAYTSKYLAKVQRAESAELDWGRWWGVEGDLSRYAALEVDFPVERDQMARLARVLDKLRLGQVRARTFQETYRRKAIKRAKRRREWLTRSAAWTVETSVLSGRLDSVMGGHGFDVYVASYVREMAN